MLPSNWRENPEAVCRDRALHAQLRPYERELVQDLVAERYLGRRGIVKEQRRDAVHRYAEAVGGL